MKKNKKNTDLQKYSFKKLKNQLKQMKSYYKNTNRK